MCVWLIWTKQPLSLLLIIYLDLHKYESGLSRCDLKKIRFEIWETTTISLQWFGVFLQWFGGVDVYGLE